MEPCTSAVSSDRLIAAWQGQKIEKKSSPLKCDLLGQLLVDSSGWWLQYCKYFNMSDIICCMIKLSFKFSNLPKPLKIYAANTAKRLIIQNHECSCIISFAVVFEQYRNWECKCRRFFLALLLDEAFTETYQCLN